MEIECYWQFGSCRRPCTLAYPDLQDGDSRCNQTSVAQKSRLLSSPVPPPSLQEYYPREGDRRPIAAANPSFRAEICPLTSLQVIWISDVFVHRLGKSAVQQAVVKVGHRFHHPLRADKSHVSFPSWHFYRLVLSSLKRVNTFLFMITTE